MVTDTERNYTGTNFVVITLAVLLVAMVTMIAYGQFSDIADDRIGTPQKQSALR